MSKDNQAPSSTIDSDEEFSRLLGLACLNWVSTEPAFAEARTKLIANIDAYVTARIAAAGMVDKSQWISVDERLPKCGKKVNSFGVMVQIWPHVKEEGFTETAFAYYGCRQTNEPNFYIYGRVLSGITHWMPAATAPAMSQDQKGGQHG